MAGILVCKNCKFRDKKSATVADIGNYSYTGLFILALVVSSGTSVVVETM